MGFRPAIRGDGGIFKPAAEYIHSGGDILDWVFLILGLLIILAGCEIFTNGIEWFGKRLKIGEGALGSIFSAVGTCLPETMVPLIALFFARQGGAGEDISVGAIIGAPFMLSTLAVFITGLSVTAMEKRRGAGRRLLADKKIISRDLMFFIFMFTTGTSSAFLDDIGARRAVAAFLVLCYGVYAFVTFRHDKYELTVTRGHYLSAVLGSRPRIRYIVIQLVIALGAIGWGAHIFVTGLEGVSLRLRLPALLLSLILTPIATELPEKLNSVLWIARRRDTLAMGNITGAMVFQGSVPMAIGMSFTAWDLSGPTLVAAVAAVIMATVLFLWFRMSRKPAYRPLLAGGLMYLLYALYISVHVFG